MTLYKYNLADQHASAIAITIVSGELIGVWNGKISYGTASYDASGMITMDLPDEVIKRLNHDLLRIVPHFQKIGSPGQPDQDMQELVNIEIMQFPSISDDEE